MAMSRSRVPSVVAGVASLALVLAACNAASPTPTYKYTGGPSSSATPSPSDTASASLSPTPEITPTDVPSPSNSPTATVPGAPTPTPSPAPTSPAQGCSGKTETIAWLAAQSKLLKNFAVYCAHLPSGWKLTSYTDSLDKGGTLTGNFAGPSGGKITVKEGAFCTTGSSACSPHDSYLGSANFGPLPGGLYSLGPGLGYAIYVNAGTTHGYTATGTSVIDTTFINIVAAMREVPKV